MITVIMIAGLLLMYVVYLMCQTRLSRNLHEYLDSITDRKGQKGSQEVIGTVRAD